MLRFLFGAALFLSLVSCVFNEELLLDQCYYDEIPNFSLQQVQEPSKTLKTFIGDDWLTNRTECYKKCCDDEFQIGTVGRCNAAAYFMGTDNKLVCQLIECNPQEKCLWSPGSPGKFAGFIRSTKTTTTTITTTTTTETVTKAPVVLSSQSSNNSNNNNNNTSTVVANSNSTGASSGNSSNVPNGTNPISGQTITEGTLNNQGLPQHEGTQQQGTVGVVTTAENSTERPETVHIEPIRRGHQVPTKGLVAGIVLAVLLLILLISFLTKQLRGMRPPVQYKPIYEEEYQKLTHEET